MPTQLLLGLVFVLAVLTGMRGLPALLLLLQPRRLRVWFLDRPEGVQVLARPDSLQGRVRRLQELGFSLLGVKAERLPLWGGVFREVGLASASEEAFASVVLRSDGRPATLYFYTPLSGGGLAFTRANSLGPETESGDTSVGNVTSDDVDKVLQDHRKRLEGLKARGLQPNPGWSPAARIDATHAFYASSYARRWMRRSPLVQAFLLSLLLLSVAVAWAVADALAGGLAG